MKRAIVVIGSAFGDCGKGLMTDYHCRHAAEETIVVRFNGGAQAGHTVVTPSGDRHVFHHYGAGTFAGARTYLSRYFLVNPIAWADEYPALQGRQLRLRLFVDPDAPLTTYYDMLVNQLLERARGASRHGSCGMGIGTTMFREAIPDQRIRAGDMLHPAGLRCRVDRLRRMWAAVYPDEPRFLDDRIFEEFLRQCDEMRAQVSFRDTRWLVGQNIIFEGAQGLLLDAKNEMFFPNVTHSRTGLTNVIPLAQEAGLDTLDVTYVMRSYLTRHGAGELPGEDPALRHPDETNAPNEWQGSLRFAPMDLDLVQDAIADDLGDAAPAAMLIRPHLAITHCDQQDRLAAGYHFPVLYESHGPTYHDVSKVTRR